MSRFSDLRDDPFYPKLVWGLHEKVWVELLKELQQDVFGKGPVVRVNGRGAEITHGLERLIVVYYGYRVVDRVSKLSLIFELDGMKELYFPEILDQVLNTTIRIDFWPPNFFLAEIFSRYLRTAYIEYKRLQE